MSALRRLWTTVTGRKAATPTELPPVVIHDPDAQKPHDLDDPFFDRTVQARIADVIATKGHKR